VTSLHQSTRASGRRAFSVWSVGVALATLAACDLPAKPAHPRLLTVKDFAALALTADADTGIAPDHGLPGGIPLRRIMANDDGTPTLAWRRTFTEGYQSGYLTTELWTGFDEVWVQPMYVAVDGTHAADGTPHRLLGAADAWRPIFGVGDRSAFYSPYWEMITFEIPAGADVDSFRSVRDVLDRGLDLTPAGGYLAVLAPDDVALPTRVAPGPGQPGVGGPGRGIGLVDGEDAPFLDFGGGTFTWNDDRVIEEAPIFMWIARDAGGVLRTLDIPTVAGTGPLYAGRPPKVLGNKPLYGSYWRLYTVEVPSGMAVFAPPSAQDVRDGLAQTPTLYDVTYAPAILNSMSPANFFEFTGRVATNPSCFTNADNLDITNGTPDPCVFLDSQAAIETLVPSRSITRTDIVVTCPFITYADGAVVSP